MQVSIEISMYPLRDEFIPPINEFINTLNKADSVEVKTNSISTQVFGDYDDVMDLLKVAMRRSHENWGTSVFVTKFLLGDSRAISGYD